jgi:outer membrane protein OmpA-like peptidoglycan-associated protein
METPPTQAIQSFSQRVISNTPYYKTLPFYLNFIAIKPSPPKKHIMKNLQYIFIALLAAGMIFTACKSMNKTQKGAVIGTTAGAATGAVVGRAAGNTGLGAIIGAAVGGITGTLIGKKMDKQAEEIAKEIPGVTVTRVGEAIILEFANDVLFGFDSYAITAKAAENLDKLVKILDEYPDTDITVVGHTDSQGSEAYNQSLSLRRADAVSDYLIKKKISGNRLTALGYGQNNPKYTNTTSTGQALNRRVEFLITANAKMVEDAKKEASK